MDDEYSKNNESKSIVLRISLLFAFAAFSCLSNNNTPTLEENENLIIADNIDAIWPISGKEIFSATSDKIADGYGPRILSGNYDFHRGIDFQNSIGTPIYSSFRKGKVVRVESAPEPGTTFERWGNWCVIAYPAQSHPDSNHNTVFQTAYLHLSKILVKEGDNINIGTKIGEVGNTGVGINTQHLHFEFYDAIDSGLIKKEHSRNPLALMPYNKRPPIIASNKQENIITVDIKQQAPNLDVIEIALLVDDTVGPILNFEKRIGMDIDDEDNDVYTFSEGNLYTLNTVVKIVPEDFSNNDSTYNLRVSFTNDVFTEVTSYQIKITNAKGEEFMHQVEL